MHTVDELLENEDLLRQECDGGLLLRVILRSPLSLKHIKKPTLEMCTLAIKMDGRAIAYAPFDKVTPEMCEMAVRSFPGAIKIIMSPSDDLVRTAFMGMDPNTRMLTASKLNNAPETLEEFLEFGKYLLSNNITIYKTDLAGIAKKLRNLTEVNLRILDEYTKGRDLSVFICELLDKGILEYDSLPGQYRTSLVSAIFGQQCVLLNKVLI